MKRDRPLIILVTTHYPPLVGGAATYFQLLADGLVHRGRNVLVLTTMVAGQPWREERGGVMIRRWIPALDRAPNSLRKTIQTIITAKAIIWFRLLGPVRTIHVHASKSVTVGAAIASTIARVPVVYDVQDFLSRPPVLRRGTRPSYVATGAPITEHLKKLGLARRPILTIPSVPPDAIRGSRPKRVESDTCQFVFVGELSHDIKGTDTLLTAWVTVHAERPSASLTIVGDGPDRQADEQFVREHHLEQRVHFMGTRSSTDTLRLMSGADALVMSSRTEGMPRVILEAFALGLPVIGPKIGGIPEVVKDWQNGLLVAPNDPAALAQAMITLNDTPRQRVAFGIAGHRWVNTLPTWHEIVERIDQHYDA